MGSKVAKFVDDINLFKLVNTKSDCEELQQDFALLNKWATK